MTLEAILYDRVSTFASLSLICSGRSLSEFFTRYGIPSQSTAGSIENYSLLDFEKITNEKKDQSKLRTISQIIGKLLQKIADVDARLNVPILLITSSHSLEYNLTRKLNMSQLTNHSIGLTLDGVSTLKMFKDNPSGVRDILTVISAIESIGLASVNDQW